MTGVSCTKALQQLTTWLSTGDTLVDAAHALTRPQGLLGHFHQHQTRGNDRNVTKRFGGVVAVDRCSLHIRRGTITGFIGPNGAALAAAGGTLLGMSVRLQPIMGWDLLLPIFAATILGGIGSPYGAMAGGLIIGLAEELSTLFIPTEYKTAVSLVRPRGVLGGWQQ